MPAWTDGADQGQIKETGKTLDIYGLGQMGRMGQLLSKQQNKLVCVTIHNHFTIRGGGAYCFERGR